MALNLKEIAGQKSNNLNFSDFEFNQDENCFIHPEGHKLAKMQAVAIDALINAGIDYTLIAPKEGSNWCRAWF